MWLRACLVAVAALALAPPPRTHAIAIIGGTVIDVSAYGTSGADIHDAAVVVQDGRITAVGPRTRTPIPRGAEGIDARGKFIVPGLIDVFATINNQAYANALLYMGVTAIVGGDETGGRRGPLFLSASPSPRVYQLDVVAGYDDTGLTPPPRTLGELIARGRKQTQVDDFARDGRKVLLLHYDVSADQVRVIAARARERGLATIGELGATRYPDALDAGVMAFVHTSRYSLELAPPDLRKAVAAAPFGPPRLQYYEFLRGLEADDPSLAGYAGTLARGGAVLIPTLSLNYLHLPWHRNPWDEPIAQILDPADIHLPADRKTGQPPAPKNATAEGVPAGFDQALLAIEAQYSKAGVHYLAGSGTDAFGTMPGISLHTELELLARIGLTPRQVLAAATANVGTAFGWPTVGQIRPGFDADLLVLDADPTADIANAKRIGRVMLAGQMLDRAALLRVHRAGQ